MKYNYKNERRFDIMAIHEIPNQALCKYKGDVTSFDDIPNFNNKALYVKSNSGDTEITWVNFSLNG